MTTNTSPKFRYIVSGLMALLGASLVFKDQYSTIAMILLVALGLFAVLKQKNKTSWRDFRVYGWIPVLFILPRVFGLFYGEWDNATKELVRSIPLVVMPLAFLWVGVKADKQQLKRWFYYGALGGILLFAIICYYPVVSTMIKEEQPLSYLLRWRYMNFNFTQPLDAHPAYVGLLVILLIVYTLFSDIVKPKWRIWLVFGLFILLFQMVARNALLVAFVLLMIYVIKSKIKWLQLVSLVAVTGLILMVLFHPSTYLKDKFFYIFQENASLTKDTRFGRLEASFDVFKQAPIFGPGPGTDNKLRMEAYLKLGQQTAHDNNYNAHNQFVEYLSTYGIVGLSIFVFALLLAFKLVIKNRNFVYLLLLAALVIAMLTESLLERALGVKYLSIVVGFILLNHRNQRDEDHISDGHRP